MNSARYYGQKNCIKKTSSYIETGIDSKIKKNQQKSLVFSVEPSPVPVEKNNYCELSIEYVYEEIFPEKHSKQEGRDIVELAKKSLVELQVEARNCLESGKRLCNGANKKMKSFVESHNSPYSSFVQQQNTRVMLEDMSKSLIEINKRLMVSEKALVNHVDENLTLKHEIDSIKQMIEEKNQLKLDSESKNIGCNAGCLLM